MISIPVFYIAVFGLAFALCFATMIFAIFRCKDLETRNRQLTKHLDTMFQEAPKGLIERIQRTKGL